MGGENSLRPELALGDFADRHELALGRGIGLWRGQRSVASTQDDRVAHPQPVRLVVIDGDMRQVGQGLSRVDQIRVERGETFRIVLDRLQGDEIGERTMSSSPKGATKVRRSDAIWPKQPRSRPMSRASERT